MTTTDRARHYLAKCPGAGEGDRDNTTITTACKLVERFDLVEPDLATLLLEWNADANTPPMTEREVRKCLRSALERTKYDPSLANGTGEIVARRTDRQPSRSIDEGPAQPLPDAETWQQLRSQLTGGAGEAGRKAVEYLRASGIDPEACGWGLGKLTAAEARQHRLGDAAAGIRFLIPICDPLTGEVRDVRRYAGGPFREGVADRAKLLPWAKGTGKAKPYRFGPDTAGVVVLWTEGELDCEAARAMGFLAVSNTCGCKSARAVAEALPAEVLPSEVVTLFDADEAGRSGSARLAEALTGRGVPAKIATWPANVPDGYDVADAVRDGWTADDLRALIDAATPYTPPEKPQIVITGSRFDKKIDDARAAVEQANNPPDLFMRSGELVDVVVDETDWPIIRKIDVDGLRDRVARAAEWLKLVKDPEVPGEWKGTPTDPPKDVVAAALARPELWHVPPIHAVTTVPTLRPDGSLLLKPGYDRATRLYFIPPADLRVPELPDEPTQQQAADAIDQVWYLFHQFPFVDPEADRASVLALLLTPMVRPVIGGSVPMTLIDAPSAGTGKSLIAEVPSIIMTGQAGFNSAPGKNDEPEWRKLLTAALRAGKTIIGFDNVEGVLRSAELARALTTPVWEDRLLGGNVLVRLPVRATWLATGNNLQVGGDIGRRCYRIRIDAKTARPHQRKGFKIPNLRGYAAEHRGELLAHLLTVARAWYVAGQPEAAEPPPLGSFEEWRRIIGGMLQFAGVGGFLSNLEQLYEEADPDAASWRAFLDAWLAMYGSRAVTTKQVADGIDGSLRGSDQQSLAGMGDTELVEALAAAVPEFLLQESGRVNRKSMGRQLAKVEGRRYPPDNIRLEKAGKDTNTHNLQWRVIDDLTEEEEDDPFARP